jgi:hypothetical protein
MNLKHVYIGQVLLQKSSDPDYTGITTTQQMGQGKSTYPLSANANVLSVSAA